MASARRLLIIGRAIVVLLVPMVVGLTPSTSLAKSTGVTNTNQCTEPSLTQSFLSWGDNNWYTFVPGETATSFSGKGWTLTGGAKIVSTTLSGGMTGSVLDMPAGSRATSPSFCVSEEYPTARAMVRDVSGAPNVSFYVTYSGGNTPSSGMPSPPTAWALSPAVKLYPSSTPGWQLATFTFVAGSNNSEVQVYNFEIDPYAKG